MARIFGIKVPFRAADIRAMASFLAFSFLVVGIAGLLLTQRGARHQLERAEALASRKFAQRRRQSAEAAAVRDLEALASKMIAGEALSRKDRKRAAALVRRLERR